MVYGPHWSGLIFPFGSFSLSSANATKLSSQPCTGVELSVNHAAIYILHYISARFHGPAAVFVESAQQTSLLCLFSSIVYTWGDSCADARGRSASGAIG